jgi:hypothetical protein
VSLLPRVPLGRAAPVAPSDVADQRPSLAPQLGTLLPPEPLPPPDGNWRTAVSRPTETSLAVPLKAPPQELGRQDPSQLDLPPADPVYIEQRLDAAGQQLLEGVSHYLSRQAQDLLQPAEGGPPPQPVREAPAYPPWPR